MTGQYSILKSHNLAYFYLTGAVEMTDCFNLMTKFYVDPKAHPDQRHFFDLSQATAVSADFAALMQLVMQLKQASRYLRSDTLCAFYVPDASLRPVIRTYQSLAEEFTTVETKVFSQSVPALRFVEVEAPLAEVFALTGFDGGAAQTQNTRCKPQE